MTKTNTDKGARFVELSLSRLFPQMEIWLKIFKAIVVIQNVHSQLRLVVNTTCLELAKPSNQQYRLTCSEYDYHCLLDETFTKEFEVCREWKWIPGGNCAYFNTYGSGNVDERQCESGINLDCSESKHQFESNKNTQFTACYTKREITSSLPTAISPIQVTTNRTWDGDIATSYSTSEVWIIFCIAGGLLLCSSVIFFILRRHGYQRLCKKVSDEECDDDKSDSYELAPLSPDVSEAKPDEQEGDKDKVSANEADNNKSADVTTDSLQGEEPTTDDKRSIGNEKSPDKMSSSGSDPVLINNEGEPKELGNTMESFQRMAPLTEEQNSELCAELFDLLNEDGQILTQEVMVAIITKMTGKSVQELTADEQVRNRWKEIMRKEVHHILNSSGCEKSINVAYGLLRIELEKEHYSQPDCKGENVGIGDDIERLYTIHLNVTELQGHLTTSVERYTSLLDTMVKALTRLAPNPEFKEKIKTFVNKMENIKCPSLTQTTFSTIIKFFGFGKK